MSEAVTVRVAKGLVAHLLNAHLNGTIVVPGGLEFRPLRSYADWEKAFDSEEACERGMLYIDVVSVIDKQSTALSSRGTHAEIVQVDIGVRRKFAQDCLSKYTGLVTIERVDELAWLVEQIRNACMAIRLDCDAVWQATEILVVPDVEHLRHWQQFTGVVRLTFALDEAV